MPAQAELVEGITAQLQGQAVQELRHADFTMGSGGDQLALGPDLARSRLVGVILCQGVGGAVQQLHALDLEAEAIDLVDDDKDPHRELAAGHNGQAYVAVVLPALLRRYGVANLRCVLAGVARPQGERFDVGSEVDQLAAATGGLGHFDDHETRRLV